MASSSRRSSRPSDLRTRTSWAGTSGSPLSRQLRPCSREGRRTRRTRTIRRFTFPVYYAYPPLLAVALSPLAVLPVDVAVVLAVVASLAALMGALYLVGVRDLRCYAVVPIWASAWNALEMANVSALLALLLALAWRFRATVWPLGAALGAMVALKLVMSPLLLWAVASRHVRGAGAALAIGIAMTLAAWAVVGFAGFLEYPDLLGRIEGQESYSVGGMARALGVGADVGRVAMVLIGGAALVACVALARAGDEQRAFVVAVASVLVLSPIHLASLPRASRRASRPNASAVLCAVASADSALGVPQVTEQMPVSSRSCLHSSPPCCCWYCSCGRESRETSRRGVGVSTPDAETRSAAKDRLADGLVAQGDWVHRHCVLRHPSGRHGCRAICDSSAGRRGCGRPPPALRGGTSRARRKKPVSRAAEELQAVELRAYVYPPLLALVTVPFTVFPSRRLGFSSWRSWSGLR